MLLSLLLLSPRSCRCIIILLLFVSIWMDGCWMPAGPPITICAVAVLVHEIKIYFRGSTGCRSIYYMHTFRTRTVTGARGQVRFCNTKFDIQYSPFHAYGPFHSKSQFHFLFCVRFVPLPPSIDDG